MIARMDNFNGNDGTRDESRSAEAIAVIGQVSRVAMAADYIYRGEPECYRKVSSSLYRHYEDIESTGFDIETVQKRSWMRRVDSQRKQMTMRFWLSYSTLGGTAPISLTLRQTSTSPFSLPAMVIMMRMAG